MSTRTPNQEGVLFHESKTRCRLSCAYRLPMPLVRLCSLVHLAGCCRHAARASENVERSALTKQNVASLASYASSQEWG
jgi:hypothetical protein